MDETREYLIPANVVARWEVLPGLGLPELAVLAAASGLGLGLAMLLAFLPGPLRLVFAALPAAMAYFATRPVPSIGGSMLDLLRLWRTWSQRPRELRWQRSWL